MSTYRFKTKPYAHQVAAVKKLLTSGTPRGGGLPMEMGTGKTKTTIDYACILEQQGVIDRVLVICPLSVIGVWELQIPQHSPSQTLIWKIINYDKLRFPQHFDPLVAFMRAGPSLLLMDESHLIKNPQAKRTKAATVLGKIAKRVVWMSGTPTEKGPLDMFAPMRVLDEGILGGSWGVFKRTYAQWGGYGGYQLIKYMNTDSLMRKIDPHVFRAKKADCLDLPRKTHTIVPVTLSKSRRVYDKLARESIVEFEQLEVETPIVLTRLLRLSQLTGGYLVGEDGSRQVGTEKLDAYTELIEEMYEEERKKVVVFCRFIQDLKDCARVASESGYRVIPFHGKTPRQKRDRLLARFDETDEPTCFVAQVATGSLGISLTAASEAIFYSHPQSRIQFDQACDRLHRIGQFHPVNYYHLIVRDSVDEAVWMSLRTKRRLAEIVMRDPGLIV